MNKKFHSSGLGVVTLVMIFAVLALTVFALLTLNTARAEQALAEKTALAVQNYYNADSKATILCATLQQELHDNPILHTFTWKDIEVQLTRDKRGIVGNYSCPVDSNQALAVRILFTTDHYRIEKWRVENNLSWENDQHLPVWIGE
ncbi:MAG: hypothetical protein RR051_01195 [Clostridiales bacterium]